MDLVFQHDVLSVKLLIPMLWIQFSNWWPAIMFNPHYDKNDSDLCYILNFL